MSKLQNRAIICLLLAFALVFGIGIYVFKLAKDGGKWITFPANKNVYSQGYLSIGSIYDRNGNILLSNNGTSQPDRVDDAEIRKATLHAVGDNTGNISTGAKIAFADKLIGYNFFSGTYSTNKEGRKLSLTIDSEVSKAANQALAGRNGTVGVYNYKTGEILCMVSSPNFDPNAYTPSSETAEDGLFMNKLLTSKIVPGSIFKVITTTAAIDNLSDLDSWSYTCTGQRQIGTAEVDKVVCPYAHGTVDFEKAFAVSCNCAYAQLAMEVGPSSMKEYTEKAGLTNSYSIDGLKTTKGEFEFPETDITLAWAGIGQYKDLLNPASMMIYMGAVANGGKSADPSIIKSVKFNNGFPTSIPIKTKTKELISSGTSDKLDEMLHNNVVSNYGEGNFPGLDLCAKSGTAELGEGRDPHAWFTGYIRNEDHPYAFIVLVENGGWGQETAGSVANTVLQEIISQ